MMDVKKSIIYMAKYAPESEKETYEQIKNELLDHLSLISNERVKDKETITDLERQLTQEKRKVTGWRKDYLELEKQLIEKVTGWRRDYLELEKQLTEQTACIEEVHSVLNDIKNGDTSPRTLAMKAINIIRCQQSIADTQGESDEKPDESD